MSDYKPAYPFNTPMHLLTPSSKTIKGVLVKTYSKPTEENMIYGSFKTYGGTETAVNGVLVVADTATIETWYRPDIKAGCRICLADDYNQVYDIIGRPENINMRNQFMKFKVQGVSGGA